MGNGRHIFLLANSGVLKKTGLGVKGLIEFRFNKFFSLNIPLHSSFVFQRVGYCSICFTLKGVWNGRLKWK